MTTLASEVLLPSESAYVDELDALYQDILARHAPDPNSPTALDKFAAGEITKELWRIRRVGMDVQAIKARVYDKGHREGRLNQWVETFERSRERNACIATIGALKQLHQDLAGFGSVAPGLKLVKSGRG